MNIFAAVFGLGLPDGLKCFILSPVHIMCILLLVAPLIEHFTQELLTHEPMA